MSKRKLLKAYPHFEILTNRQLSVAEEFEKLVPHWLIDSAIITDIVYLRDTYLQVSIMSPMQREIRIVLEEFGDIVVHFDPYHAHFNRCYSDQKWQSTRIKTAVQNAVNFAKRIMNEELIIVKKKSDNKFSKYSVGCLQSSEFVELQTDDTVFLIRSWRGTYDKNLPEDTE